MISLRNRRRRLSGSKSENEKHEKEEISGGRKCTFVCPHIYVRIHSKESPRTGKTRAHPTQISQTSCIKPDCINPAFSNHKEKIYGGTKMSKVAVIMGSDSDYKILVPAIQLIKKYGVTVDVNVISAHRTPELAKEYASNAEKNGVDVLIAAAGMAAHLPGVIAAFTTLPVIGVPIQSACLEGMDALLAMVQMPSGIPVATVAINGAKNAAILALQILARSNPELRTVLKEMKESMKQEVMKKNETIKAEVEKL